MRVLREEASKLNFLDWFALKVIYRFDRKETEAQKQFRRLDKEVLKCDGESVKKKQDSRFTAMVNQSYGGMRTFSAFVGTGKWRTVKSVEPRSYRSLLIIM